MTLPELNLSTPVGNRASSGLAARLASSTTEWLTCPLLCHSTVWPAVITIVLGWYMGMSSFIWMILTGAGPGADIAPGDATEACTASAVACGYAAVASIGRISRAGMAQISAAHLVETPGPRAELIASLNTFVPNMQNKHAHRNRKEDRLKAQRTAVRGTQAGRFRRWRDPVRDHARDDAQPASLARRISLTSLGLPLPAIAFMTWPTKKPKSLSRPPRYSATLAASAPST